MPKYRFNAPPHHKLNILGEEYSGGDVFEADLSETQLAYLPVSLVEDETPVEPVSTPPEPVEMPSWVEKGPVSPPKPARGAKSEPDGDSFND